MNLEHHTEQMEAMRAEFARLWQDTLEQRACILRPLNQDISLDKWLAYSMDIAWQAFRAGKSLQK